MELGPIISVIAYHFTVDEDLSDVGAEAVDHVLQEGRGVADRRPVAHRPNMPVEQLEALVNCGEGI